MERKNCWEIWDEREKENCFKFCENYKNFISINKTERKFLSSCIKLAEENGFKDIKNYEKISPGDKFYKINRGKEGIFGICGEKSPLEGCKFIVAHIDSPRIDLKTNPLYEDEGLCFLKTYYYGGIKKYQWLTIPLAFYGFVVLKDGKKVEIEIGDKEGDPVFTITDLLPHLAKDQIKKTIEEGFPGENLNILSGSIMDTEKKDEKEKVKRNVLKILKENYGIEEEDFISGEFQIVPAGKALDLGFDKSMVLAYGQDDRVCSYTSFQALLKTTSPKKSIFCILVDQEEIGSKGATSAQSSFFTYFMEEFIEKTGGKVSELKEVFENSKAISADVDSLFDPNFKEVHDPRNAARLGCGVILTKITGGRGKIGSIEPTAEYLSYIRRIFDKNNVIWQPGEIGKVEQGGGGTVATYFARYNIDTVDCGTGVLSMHAPYEVTSKADIYSTYLAYLAFYKEE
ncbi:MAG: aminopeptidase [Candidatus Omnitrophota bacterium]|nr:MAG: aminopeptidase [Candidatus Omnitrophota bacterium]